MNEKTIKDIGASVRQRLVNLAHKAGRPFDEVLQYYMIEHFIYRLSKSPYKNRLILKGALMLVVWNLTEARATRDIDFLGQTPNSLENILKIIQDICEISYPEDECLPPRKASVC
jgi:predicted nucleotidyltransferase component of viral defense system